MDDYYGNAYVDSVAMILCNFGKRCSGCSKPTFYRYLEDNKCPICRGKEKPIERFNGGIKCDVDDGPCSCGAFH